MAARVAINGFGRIGRDFLRCVLEQPERSVEVVAVNDLVPPETLAHLLEFDSTYGRLAQPVRVHRSTISVGSQTIHVAGEADPAKLPWGELDVDVVIESTGRFRTREAAAAHLAAGARKVIISAPGKDVDATIVMGINDDTYDPDRHAVISNASCTTNCVAPMAYVLHRAFGVRRGLMTTIHSYTNDQSLLDGPHKDLRRARSAAVNLIPTSTGAARAIGEVLPELAGRLDGVAVRVPVEDGSLTDLTVELAEPVTEGQVNRAFAEAAAGDLKDFLRYTEQPIVSRDIIGDPASCVFDASLTKAGGQLAKVFGWYDNEWGYAQRTLDLVGLVARQLG
ncbi:type I glyceraldehyde-3-phosphate dehydrogenase [Amycolatopsis sp. GM8]|uniref:type I glyceraldehyde-3-phosphate dehydrogenase n=1 Tax=Amycolatopsis sp. GM8 TaxID=2896530 RepID=UPI001F00CB17|nr:type I glyceraldehyde-3-phosphate dehydrogenase [Amycolatopsis sp. GM8]